MDALPEIRDSQTPAITLTQLSRAMRFALVAVIAFPSYFNIRLACGIDKFHQIYHDMLGNKPLPLGTQFLIDHQSAVIGLSIALPVAAILCIFPRVGVRSFYILAVLILLSATMLDLQWHYISAPLTSIIQGMQDASDSH